MQSTVKARYLLAIASLFIPQIIQGMDVKEFSVPLSLIKASKMLFPLYGNMLIDESQTFDGDDEQKEVTITSENISRDDFSLIEPYCALIGKLHALRKQRHYLQSEITFIYSDGSDVSTQCTKRKRAGGESENSKLKRRAFSAKYPHIRALDGNARNILRADVKQKIQVLNQERASIYNTLYFALKKLRHEELYHLMLLADIWQIKTLQSVLITMAYLFSEQELQQLPQHLLEKIQAKKAKKRSTILHWACSRGILDVVKDVAAQENKSINEETTPLHCAARQGDPVIIKFLLERGASAEAANRDDQTPLHTACIYGKTEAVKVLLGKGPYSGYRSAGTALHFACHSNKETAELVYNHYRRLDDRDGNGETPLLRAATFKNTATVRFLLDKRANVRATDSLGRSALHHACHNFPPFSIVQMLVAAGSPLDTVDFNGLTPLHLACSGNSLTAVQHLTAQNGVNVHQKTKHGTTALQVACILGNDLPIVQFLWEQCGCGFDDLNLIDLEKLREPIRSYLKEQKAAIERRERDRKEEVERLRERRAHKKNAPY